MIELQNNTLRLSFPEVHPDARCTIDFQRTLRIPDDNRTYPLPAGLGRFPLHHVDDFAAKVPPRWLDHGGIFMPMYQAEALWIHFGSGWSEGYPFAIKVAAGKINAVSGETWRGGLHAKPQDYLVVPEQPWLDGFSVQKGLIRQFVAMPLGQGFTAEEQITGAAEHGGLQIQIFPMRPDRYRELVNERSRVMAQACMARSLSDERYEMGLAPGGLMRQEIAADRYGVDAWDQSVSARCFVHIANSSVYREITGCRPPTEPITAADYKAAGIPWFDYYAADMKVLEGAPKLAGLDSVAAKTIKQGGKVSEPVVTIDESAVVKLGENRRPQVREGDF